MAHPRPARERENALRLFLGVCLEVRGRVSFSRSDIKSNKKGKEHTGCSAQPSQLQQIMLMEVSADAFAIEIYK